MRHLCELRGAIQADGDMTELPEGPQVAAGSAAEIQDLERRRCLDVLQQRRDVLTDVVAARAGPEILGLRVVVRERPGLDAFEVLGRQGRVRSRGDQRRSPVM
jgi:hypothetical protein